MSEPQAAASTSGPESPVEQAVRRLDGLQDRPAEEHVEVYETVHADLRRALDGQDDGPGVGADETSGLGNAGS